MPTDTQPAAGAGPDDAASTFRYRRWLHWFLVAFIVATFSLIAMGGQVTSQGAGLAVPDGWTSFNHFVLTTPVSKWVIDPETGEFLADQFVEHSHRIKGTIVGMMAITIAIWLTVTQRRRRWVVTLGWVLLAFVIVQGALGAMRVDLISTRLAMVHGITGQIFFGLCVLAAAATGRTWLRLSHAAKRPVGDGGQFKGLRLLAIGVLAAILIQLVLGAALRHSAAWLAIPDFPLNYGGVLPPFDQEGISDAYRSLPPELQDRLIGIPSPGQVAIHFAHRAWAIAVCLVGVAMLVQVARKLPGRRELVTPLTWFGSLLLIQVGLGIAVIWTGRNIAMATAHQATGAILLAVAVWVTIRLHLVTLLAPGASDETAASASESTSPTLQGQPA